MWLFGGVDRNTGMWFGRFVENRTKELLSEIIRYYIRPGTLIMSDMFSSYISSDGRHTLENNPALEDMGYTHHAVNHSTNFVNPDNGAHTQTIEGVWEIHIKRHIKVSNCVCCQCLLM